MMVRVFMGHTETIHHSFGEIARALITVLEMALFSVRYDSSESYNTMNNILYYNGIPFFKHLESQHYYKREL